MKKLFLKKQRLIFTVFLLFSFLIITGTPLFAQDEDSIAKQVYYEYFKTSKVDYNETQKIFSDDYAPVAAFIASKALVSPAEVNKIFINSNKDWYKVMLHFNIAPSSLFLPVPANYKVGPPYGKAYGYWRKHQGNPKYKIKLNSNDINNLVNLNIIHSYYKTPATDIIKYRCEGNSFKWIIKNRHAYKNKVKVQVKEKNQGQGKDKGKGKNKDKDEDNDNGKGKGKGKNK